MCGRFSQAQEIEDLLDEFPFIDKGFEDLILTPRYNIAPTQLGPVIINEDGKNKLKMFKWGLIPFWADSEDIYLINARTETVNEKSSFKGLFKKYRCLVVADGFYEWTKANKHKVPYRITLKDQKLFGFAGLWNKWDKGSRPIFTFTILTVNSNELVGKIHNRMPLIIDKDNYDIWLNPKKNEMEIKEIMQLTDSEKMDMYEVSTVVNNPDNDFLECIKPIK
ncbi:MAG: SOS response-associated peptidase [Thermodesulfobacteriota bacterium]